MDHEMIAHQTEDAVAVLDQQYADELLVIETQKEDALAAIESGDMPLPDDCEDEEAFAAKVEEMSEEMVLAATEQYEAKKASLYEQAEAMGEALDNGEDPMEVAKDFAPVAAPAPARTRGIKMKSKPGLLDGLFACCMGSNTTPANPFLAK
jgi:hypothetical protein